MKKLFRKAMNVASSAALVGMTVGLAAAASYPEPFTSNTAIVVGANAAPSDNIAAASVASNLDANAATTGTTTISTDGDSYKFEKTNTKFHLGDTIGTVIGAGKSIDEDDMPVLLAKGEYTDKNNDDFDYSQKVVMNDDLDVNMWEDTDYDEDEPTVGMKIDDGDHILNYTFTFDDKVAAADMDTTDLPLMGKEYYVLEAAVDKITLLDSAADAIVAEGETTTITAAGKSYTVSIEYVESGEAKLNVNGEITNKLTDGDTYKLDDGSYLGLKETLFASKDTGISKVEFSIGSGKLILEDGKTVELNEDDIDGVEAYITNSSGDIESITLVWEADDDLFVTETSSVTMPGFEALTLSYTGIDFPMDEKIVLEASSDEVITLSDFPMKGTTEDINILFFDGIDTYTAVGKEALKKHLSLDGTFDGDDEDEWTLLTWADTDDAESYLVRCTNWDDDENETDVQYRKDGAWTDAKTSAGLDDDISIGELSVTIDAIDAAAKTVTFAGQSSDVLLYSEEGMKVDLTAVAAVAGTNATTVAIDFTEENEDGDLGAGSAVTITLGENTENEPEVSTISSPNETSVIEIQDTDVKRSFLKGDLATEILFDIGGDQDKVTLMYHGEEVMAGVYLTSSDAVMTSGDAGVMTVKDSEVASVAGKNLVVVGGSAINSVAADLLGGAYAGAMFTSATGVGAGEFLIQSFDRAGKTALLVAGYNAADTEKAVTYLLNNDVDTTVGMKMKGTSATEATVVTA